MKKLFLSRSLHIFVAGAVIVFIGFMVVSLRNGQPIDYVTSTVDRSAVQQLVSVTGIVEAEQSAQLAFPTTGIVETVSVRQGDVVQAGDVLITLESRALQADRQDAFASLARAVASRDELLAGPQSESRDATAGTVAFKATTLETIRATQADLVDNAYRTLLSTDLTAASDDASEEAIAPIVSGTYTCEAEGRYTLETYASAAASGYSFRLSGLESGTYTVSSDQPVRIGDCGIQVLFNANSRYGNTTWTIDVPNQESARYITNRNAYTLAQTQAASAITIAEQDLALSETNAASTNAPARSESIARANADIASANARIARVDAQIADRTIRAPFAGTITTINVLPGESVGTSPVLTLLAATDFELTARIPEIDIGKLAIGQAVRTVFDAQPEQELIGVIEFISLQATIIDGVAYYDAIISLDETPTWMRSGLNADIDIVIIETTDTARIPSRFITQSDGVSQVRTLVGELVSTSTIEVILTGNDGFSAITGINEGDIVVAP